MLLTGDENWIYNSQGVMLGLRLHTAVKTTIANVCKAPERFQIIFT